MNILITGATGFIGRHISARLLKEHKLILAVRDIASAKRRFPGCDVVPIDMNKMTNPEQWTPLLKGVDAVVNCAGILQSTRTQRAEAIHDLSPKALFDACVQLGIRKIIQISAISADSEANTEYATTKKSADDYLGTLDIDWVVLRPSLVYGHGSYGGTSLLRGLAGLPVIPLVGGGMQKFQPIHISDLCKTVVRCLDPLMSKITLEPVGPEILTTRDVVIKTRNWLNLRPAHIINIPLSWFKQLAKIGDVIPLGPICSTTVAQMEYGNISKHDFSAKIGFKTKFMDEVFSAEPSCVQELWQAKLYFFKPITNLSLVFLWYLSGLSGLFNFVETITFLQGLGLPLVVTNVITLGFSFLDIMIATFLVLGKGKTWLGWLQFSIVAIYTVGLSLAFPYLVFDPLGRLIKNIPILALIGVWSALREDH